MAGYPGELNDPTEVAGTRRPRRSGWPWILTIAAMTFALGMLANPWFEREVRSRMPFGAGEDIAAPTPVSVAQTTETATVKRRLQSLEDRPVSGASNEELAAMSTQADRLDALEKRFDALDERSSTALANSARAEGMLLALAARRAIDTGQSLGVIEGMLRDRFGGTQPQAVAALVTAGQKPVTLSQLQAGLQTLEPQLQQASHGESWWSDLRSDIAGLIMFKRETEPVTEPVEQLKDARQRLILGDVAGALWQVNRLSEGARAKAAAWTAAARRYLVARQALDTLETVALLAPPPGQIEQVIPLPSVHAAPAPTSKTPAGN